MMKRHKKHRGRNEVVIIGVAWYRPEQWDRLRQISEDTDKLETKYEEWESQALKTVRELETAGIKIEKVEVDVDELLSYCREQGLEVNAENRSRFVTEKLSKRDRRDQKAVKIE